MFSLKKLFSRLTTKIILMILVAILPLNLAFIIASQNYQKAVIEQAQSSGKVILNLYMAQMDNEIDHINAYFSRLLYDADFLRVLEQSGDNQYIVSEYSIYQKFSEDIEYHSLPVGLYIYMPELDTITIAMSSEKSRQQNSVAQYLKNEELLNNFLHWNYIEMDNSMFLLRVFKLNGVYYGGLIFLDEMVNSILSELDYQYEEIIYGDERADFEPETLQITVESKKEKLSMQLRISENEIYYNQPILEKLIYFFSLSSFIIIPIIYQMLRRLLLRPLRRIDDALCRVKNGEKDYRIGRQRCSLEFIRINQSFDDMSNQIESLKTENLKQELDRKRMELQNLRLQVKPHFLINNFNLMYSMAQLKDYAGIQKVLIFLSHYFRYIFRNDKELQPLRDEMRIVKDFLEVADMQYNNCLVVRYDIKEETLDIGVPLLLLYNFVENIVKHAVKVDEVIHIFIGSESTPECLRIIIEDDGQGIEPQILDCIRLGEPIEKDDGQHIGIWNSRNRLKTICCEDADIEVFSELGKGTKVVIRLPWDEVFE